MENGTIFAKSRAEIDRDFEVLDRLLKTTPLPIQAGGYRHAGANEFMWMHQTAEGIRGFKHRVTRNYIFMVPAFKGAENVFSLYVPLEPQKPFNQGWFDNPRVDFCNGLNNGCKWIGGEPDPVPECCPLCKSTVVSFGGNGPITQRNGAPMYPADVRA